MDTLKRIIEYIEGNKVSWQLPYLPSLNILLQNKEKINSELLDNACKNVQNLIYEAQTDNLFKTANVFEELLVYNAFVYYVEYSLNQGKTEYHFMLFPGLTEDSGASEIYYQEEQCKHVFMMELQEEMMSNKETTFIVLCHELAHYVGSTIRCRSKRLDKLYNIYSRLTILGLKTTLAQIQSIDGLEETIDFDNKAWNQVEQNLSQWIKLYYKREIHKDFIEATSIYDNDHDNENNKPQTYNIENQEHMFFIPAIMKKSICDILKNKSTTILEPIIIHCFKNIGYDERELLIQKCTEAILIDAHPDNMIFSFASTFAHIEYILKEAYADLISILELELTPFQYLHCLVSQYSLKNPKRYGVKVCARIALVVYTMCHVADKKKSAEYTWDDEALIAILEMDTEEGRTLNAVYKFIYNTIPESYFENPEAISELYEKAYMVLFDKVILKEIFDYLSTCKMKFYSFQPRSLKKVRAFFSGENYENYLQEYKELIINRE